ncbi:pyridine nucleotide-disulfide oxidoreductase-domain-containing protein [Apiospora marii]|uniref:Pyridine nucleotide-disulfide oxidoreductase-domain-containing protein n=1 Tax=Apiospora marii TaxID=335849 RepID=A0ABR1RCH2_9PEZI
MSVKIDALNKGRVCAGHWMRPLVQQSSTRCFALGAGRPLYSQRLAQRVAPFAIRTLVTDNSDKNADTTQYSAIVVGGGAAGIAVTGSLLDHLGPGRRIAWVDPSFSGGRITACYREVPSNTIAQTFLDYGQGFESFRRAAQTSREPNGLTKLAALEPKSTCSLYYAGHMLQTLSNGLRRDERVDGKRGMVVEAVRAQGREEWVMTIQTNKPRFAPAQRYHLAAPLVVYCTGSHPATVPLPTPPAETPPNLGLDDVLKPSVLKETLPKDRPVCVGVVGASHSAILVLRNLLDLARDSHPQLRVRWFTRHTELKYAEYKDGWILYDNTGLKGLAAEFGRQYLEGDQLAKSGAGDIITRVDCSGGEEQEKAAFLRELPGCDHVVQAVGFSRNKLPEMEAKLEFDNITGGFTDRATGRPVPGLFGAGIAFPERVTDKAGNVEYAVGFFKFMKFLKRVVPSWVGKE